MRGVVGFLVMFVTSSVWAEEWLPTLKRMIEPVYPKELQRMHVDGAVRVKVIVKADGSVVEPKIVYSTHPLFAGAALKVIGEWRFASRPLSGENPQELVVFVPFKFEFEEQARAVEDDLTLDITTATCLQLNRDVNKYVGSGPTMPLANLPVFRITETRLVDGFIAEKYDNESLVVGLYDLSQGMLKVAKTCQRRISRRVVDLMPPSVKALLVAGGMEIKSE